jgi:hypothetical protein
MQWPGIKRMGGDEYHSTFVEIIGGNEKYGFESGQ